MPKKRGDFLFRLRERDTANGVTRNTLGRLAFQLGLSETDVIHKALADCARTNLPQYEADEGPLTDAQHQRIADEVRRDHGEARVTAHLFDDASAREPTRDGRKSVRPPSRAR